MSEATQRPPAAASQDEPDRSAPRQTRLVYFGDAMCSWCYGFAPQIERMRAALADRAGFRLFAGGLRPYTREPMDEGRRTQIREHWEHVAQASGQPFDHAFFEREGFVYDTEPASRAVVTMRGRAPQRALDYMHAIQTAFYAENRDVTDESTLAEIATRFVADREQFLQALRSDAMKAAVREDFAAAASAGVTGFPTLLLETPRQTYLVTQGYVKAEGLLPALLEVI
ncbi:MAG: DsbA family protein, partial [Burkholderiales bacterium]